MTPLSPSEIDKMRAVCSLAAETLSYGGGLIKAGVSANEVDRLVHEFTLKNKAIPAPLGYNGFPKSCCISINEVICHGVPDDTVFKDGDIVNLDVTCLRDGFHGDTSATFFVGVVSDVARDITDCAEKAMWRGIEEVRAGATTGDIGFEISKLVNKRGYHVVRDIGGHGIGRKFHDDPFVPSYGKKGRGTKLLANCCITIEPMVNETGAELSEFAISNSDIKYYLTGDRTLSAQFEHTVLITQNGYEVLTK